MTEAIFQAFNLLYDRVMDLIKDRLYQEGISLQAILICECGVKLEEIFTLIDKIIQVGKIVITFKCKCKNQVQTSF